MRCDVLCSSRKQTVYGEGNVEARVCFFGEAPGEEEDSTGRPFVGRSGALLTKMIEACTLSRDQVYILNTVKCRPPGNRNPTPDEIANCREYFEEQLQIIQPQYIVCLGLVAVQTLLKTTQSIGKLRSRFHKYHNSKVLATYHPSYLLRYPDVKREAWADLKMLMADMGIDVASQTKKT
jgi:DNA polymerase